MLLPLTRKRTRDDAGSTDDDDDDVEEDDDDASEFDDNSVMDIADVNAERVYCMSMWKYCTDCISARGGGLHLFAPPFPLAG